MTGVLPRLAVGDRPVADDPVADDPAAGTERARIAGRDGRAGRAGQARAIADRRTGVDRVVSATVVRRTRAVPTSGTRATVRSEDHGRDRQARRDRTGHATLGHRDLHGRVRDRIRAADRTRAADRETDGDRLKARVARTAHPTADRRVPRTDRLAPIDRTTAEPGTDARRSRIVAARPGRGRCRHLPPWVPKKSWSPVGARSRRPSSPGDRRSGCSSSPSAGRRSRSSSSTPRTCGSRSSRSREGR